MGFFDFFTGAADKTLGTLETANKVYSLYESVIDGRIDDTIQSALSLLGSAYVSHNKNEQKRMLIAALEKRNAILQYDPCTFEEEEALSKMLDATNKAIIDISNRLGYYDIANSVLEML